MKHNVLQSFWRASRLRRMFFTWGGHDYLGVVMINFFARRVRDARGVGMINVGVGMITPRGVVIYTGILYVIIFIYIYIYIYIYVC